MKPDSSIERTAATGRLPAHLASLGLLLALIGCTTDPASKAKLPAQDQVPGTASIRGELHRTLGSRSMSCADRRVLLFPWEAGEQIKPIMLAKHRVPQPEDLTAELRRTVRFAHCDAQGSVAFHDLPAIEWGILAEVQVTFFDESRFRVIYKSLVTKEGEEAVLNLDEHPFKAD